MNCCVWHVLFADAGNLDVFSRSDHREKKYCATQRDVYLQVIFFNNTSSAACHLQNVSVMVEQDVNGSGHVFFVMRSTRRVRFSEKGLQLPLEIYDSNDSDCREICMVFFYLQVCRKIRYEYRACRKKCQVLLLICMKQNRFTTPGWGGNMFSNR